MTNSTLAHGNGIRVALVGLPRLLHEIIALQVRRQLDMELVVDATSADDYTLIRESGADVVIVGLEGDQPALGYPEVVRSLTQIAVLGVTERGNRTVLYRLRPEAIELGEVSPAELLAATRTAVGRPLAREP